MKLLFDQNISFRILSNLDEAFSGSIQVREIRLEDATDKNIWEYARAHGFSIVTFDIDFVDLANLYGHPPKIIWMRCGNAKTSNLAELINKKRGIISDFIDNDDNSHLSFLELSN